MNRKDSVYERLGNRYRTPVTLAVILVFVFISAVCLFLWITGSRQRRVMLVVAANPATVISLDQEKHAMVVMAIPASAHIVGIHGVGRYSLEALWKLGKIDPKDGGLLSQSLAEFVGLPVDKYIGSKSETLLTYPDSVTELKSIFSFPGLFAFIAGRYRTNISLPTFLSLAWTIPSLRIDDITTFDIGSSTVLFDDNLPDGTTVKIVDPDRLDNLIGSAFEDERIRAESLRIAVYNTTPTPELSSRAERLLDKMGAIVVFVGNDTPQTDKCIISGRKKYLGTATAKFITNNFGCTLRESEDDSKADLILRLGKVYERRFLPQN